MPVDKIREQFNADAVSFDAGIESRVPRYREMLDALVSALPFAPNAAAKIIDLGCGTGTLLQLIRRTFPNAHLTGVDMAENMLAIAQGKLGGNAEFLSAGIEDFVFPKRFDAIVSSLALHHLETDDAKRAAYAKIFAALEPGGVFVNADLASGSGEATNALYLRKWREHLLLSLAAEQVDGDYLRKHDENDRPVPLTRYFAFLEEAGFAEIDVIWKYYGFAVCLARKAK